MSPRRGIKLSSTTIYDPRRPPLIFDGLLDVYGTCRDCGTLMKVIRADEHSHPCCATVQTQLESLGDLWIAETRDGHDERAHETEELMESMRNIELGAAAYDYATWGWHVFPLGKRTKKPAIPKDKGGSGFKQATNNPTRIEKWWERHPEHNIGLATGHGFDVIDIDTKDKDGNPTTVGINSFMTLLTAHKVPECHGVAITASGGMHLYVKATGKGIYAGLRPGIDYRGLGGYVVAPPSLLRAPGRAYTWLVEPSPIIKGDW
jgi:hypothetical protein